MSPRPGDGDVRAVSARPLRRAWSVHHSPERRPPDEIGLGLKGPPSRMASRAIMGAAPPPLPRSKERRPSFGTLIGKVSLQPDVIQPRAQTPTSVKGIGIKPPLSPISTVSTADGSRSPSSLTAGSLVSPSAASSVVAVPPRESPQDSHREDQPPERACFRRQVRTPERPRSTASRGTGAVVDVGALPLGTVATGNPSGISQPFGQTEVRKGRRLAAKFQEARGLAAKFETFVQLEPEFTLQPAQTERTLQAAQSERTLQATGSWASPCKAAGVCDDSGVETDPDMPELVPVPKAAMTPRPPSSPPGALMLCNHKGDLSACWGKAALKSALKDPPSTESDSGGKPQEDSPSRLGMKDLTAVKCRSVAASPVVERRQRVRDLARCQSLPRRQHSLMPTMAPAEGVLLNGRRCR